MSQIELWPPAAGMDLGIQLCCFQLLPGQGRVVLQKLCLRLALLEGLHDRPHQHTRALERRSAGLDFGIFGNLAECARKLLPAAIDAGLNDSQIDHQGEASGAPALLRAALQKDPSPS